MRNPISPSVARSTDVGSVTCGASAWNRPRTTVAVLVAHHDHRWDANVDDLSLEFAGRGEIADAKRVHHLLQARRTRRNAYDPLTHHAGFDNGAVVRQPLRDGEGHPGALAAWSSEAAAIGWTGIDEHLHVFADELPDLQVLRLETIETARFHLHRDEVDVPGRATGTAPQRLELPARPAAQTGSPRLPRPTQSDDGWPAAPERHASSSRRRRRKCSLNSGDGSRRKACRQASMSCRPLLTTARGSASTAR